MSDLPAEQGNSPSPLTSALMTGLDTNQDKVISEEELDMLNKELGAGGLLRILNLLKKLIPGFGGAIEGNTQSAAPQEQVQATTKSPEQQMARQKLLGGG